MKYKLYKNIIIAALSLLLVSNLEAEIYSDNYRVIEHNQTLQKNDNLFMDGYFEEIHRYDMILFSGERIQEESQKTLARILQDLKKFKERNKEFKVTLLGHTNRFTDDENEAKIDSQTYANAVQNMFRSSLGKEESLQLSKVYVQEIEKRLVDENISKELLFPEYRGGKDEVYTNATDEGIARSNGVMVTIYIEKEIDIDSDRDGVYDRDDVCPGTPRGVKVDANGCPIDSDRDGVLDYKDKCPQTPPGVRVDKTGCPLDSDGDGVADYKDRCPNTPINLNVDPNGCPLKSTLKLHFKTDSDKILQDSYPEIQRFADFLKKNEAYKVQITGHTDSVGKAVYNMLLSQRRAKMTKEALVREGVDASRLTTRGRGELDPIESNFTAEGRKVNRRIEVELLLEEQILDEQ